MTGSLSCQCRIGNIEACSAKGSGRALLQLVMEESYHRGIYTVALNVDADSPTNIECHGRHLPLGTDMLIPEKIADLIEEKSDILIQRCCICK